MAALARRPYRQRLRADATQALRGRILDAMLTALKAQDYDLISLDGLAESAGTTRQTVIRLFGSKEGVFKALFVIVDAQITAERFDAGSADLATLAHAVMGDFEVNGGFILRLLRQEARLPILAEHFAAARVRHLARLRKELAPLLARLDPASAETALLQARAVTDTLFWSVLRRDIGLDPAAAEAMLLDLLRKIFAGAASGSDLPHPSSPSGEAS